MSQIVYLDGYPEDNIDSYIVGKPVFLSGTTYINADGKGYTINDSINDSTVNSKYINGLVTTGDAKTFAGIVISVIETAGTPGHLVRYATCGKYVVKVDDSSKYNIGDVILYDGSICENKALQLTSSVVGTCIMIMDGYVLVFKR